MKIVLAGNPNCGKSTLFNALTGAHAKTGNWHGVTVGENTRTADLCGEKAEITDLPGIYTLNAYSMEEKLSQKVLSDGDYDAAVCVADALTLPRSLGLVKDLMDRNVRAVLVVTMSDLLKKRGGKLDGAVLSERLGIPVLCIDAHRRSDIRKLKEFLSVMPKSSRKNGAEYGGLSVPEKILEGIYEEGNREETRAERLMYNPYFALPFFFFLLLSVFFLAFAPYMPGTLLKDLLEMLLADKLGGALSAMAESAGAVVAADFLRALFAGVGMLLSFLPQIAILYLALFLMEESGYLSALAFMTDGLFRRVGLTGRAAFSVLMGFGCTAAAVLTTRGLENRKLQTRVICILGYISCSAKMPVYLAIASCFFENAFLSVTAIYFAGVVLAFGAALVLKGKEEETFVLEIAHIQRPDLSAAAKSLLFSLKQFIIKIVTAVTGFLIVMWFLLSFAPTFEYVGQGSEESMLVYLCRGLRFLFYPMGITQWQVALAACSGLVAKESVAGMLAMFYGTDLTAAMSAASAMAFVLFIMTCSPCVSAIAATARELGIRRALLIAGGQTGIAFLLSYLLYGLLAGGAIAATFLALGIPVAVLVYFLFRRVGTYAKIHRAKGTKAQRFYR